MLNAQDIAAMTTQVNASLDTACQVQRKGTPTSNGYGGTTATWGNQGAATKCTLAKPSGAMLQAYADMIGDLTSWLVRLPSVTDVQRGDRLVVAGQTLTVQAVLNPQSYSFSTSVLASEVR